MKPLRISALTLYPTIVIYGPSGVGKTKVAASAPMPHFMDSNKGVLTLDGIKELRHVRGNDVNSMEDLDMLFKHFAGTRKPNFSQLFKTTVLDHFDDIQAIIIEQLGEKGAAKDDRRDPDVLEMRDWGVMGNKLKRYLRKYKRLPVVKILICGEKEGKDGRMTPSLMGQLGSSLPYFADHVFYMKMGSKGRRFLCMDPTDAFYAKTRAHWLPPELRKQLVRWDDHTFLTSLLGVIAAGPSGLTSRGVSEE
jgi:hypothetical protein